MNLAIRIKTPWHTHSANFNERNSNTKRVMVKAYPGVYKSVHKLYGCDKAVKKS